MDIQGNNILITGGSEGIGKSLAKKFLEAGNRVIVTGRNEVKLRKAERELPNLETFVNDIGDSEQRIELVKHIKTVMPKINVLINNAGIQRRVALAAETAPWLERQMEIDILFSAPIHLNHMLIPVILANKQPSLIINVTSGGAYIPQVFAPVYSACKAALHNYTATLRHSLSNTNVRVLELIPPAVQTGLAGGETKHGVPLEEFANSVFNRLFSEEMFEIAYGATDSLLLEDSKKHLGDLFQESSEKFKVKIYHIDE